jgi:hypothetical protein
MRFFLFVVPIICERNFRHVAREGAHKERQVHRCGRQCGALVRRMRLNFSCGELAIIYYLLR